MSDPKQKLTGEQIIAAELEEWRQLGAQIHARFHTKKFAAGLRLTDAIAAAAEEANHHPDIRLTYPAVEVSLSSHDVGGLTSRDVELARRISEIAREQGIAAQPTDMSLIEIGLDTPDQDRIAPFWEAVLGYQVDGNEIRDPSGRGIALWFQGSKGDEGAPQRFHLDVWVAHEVAQARIDAAIAAGGTIIRDESPSFVALADPEGNAACICTSRDRQ